MSASRPVLYTPYYIVSSGMFSNYMVIFRAINNHIISKNTTRIFVFLRIKYGSARFNRAGTINAMSSRKPSHTFSCLLMSSHLFSASSRLLLRPSPLLLGPSRLLLSSSRSFSSLLMSSHLFSTSSPLFVRPSLVFASLLPSFSGLLMSRHSAQNGR